jgi:hypothetical protein
LILVSHPVVVCLTLCRIDRTPGDPPGFWGH